jgi:uncharacterized membrane protein YgaE (UPF0421/DUF939 family)
VSVGRDRLMLEQLQSLIVARKNPVSLSHTARTAAIAVVSFLVAKLFRLPEAYWAAITTLVVVQSPVTAASTAAQYFAGTAIGAAAGGWAGTYFPGSVLVFGVCILAIGIVLTPLRLERGAYRYAVITLAIVMLIPGRSGWIVALHRFLEVSVGIAVGLTVSTIWPERGVQ